MSEPRAIELVDFVLLACQFAVIGEDGTPDPDEQRGEPPGFEVDGARLHVLSLEEDTAEGEFVFVLQTTLVDPGSPYSLEVITGSRFTVPEPPVTAREAASTLLFISYPYVRELVASITSRSPFQVYRLPPLTKRPVWGEIGEG